MAERPVTALTGGQATEAATLTIVKSPSSTLDQLLEQVDSPAADAEAAPSARAAQLPEPPRLVLVRGLRWMSEQQLEVAFRTGEPFAAVVAAEVDRELLNQATPRTPPFAVRPCGTARTRQERDRNEWRCAEAISK